MNKKSGIEKLLQLFAFIVLAFMLAFFAEKVYDTVQFGIYNGVADYTESDSFQQQMEEDAQRIAEMISSKKLEVIPSFNGSASNFVFSVYQSDGTYLFGNGDETQYANVKMTTMFDPRSGEENYYIYYEVNESYPVDDAYSQQHEEFEKLYNGRYLNTAAMAVSLAGIIVLYISLAKKATRNQESGALTNLIDSVPLDLLLILYVLTNILYFVLIENVRNSDILLSILRLAGFTLIMLLSLSLLLSAARRMKNGQWYTNTFAYRFVLMMPQFNKEFPNLLKYILAAIALLVAIPIILMRLHPVYGVLFYGIYGVLLVIICCYQFTSIQQIRRKANDLMQGRYDEKLDDKALMGVCKGMAEELNRISDGLNEALQKNISSERLKIELITNVSHDLKTPLTSILNYIDLLKREHSDEQETEYLQILDKQAKRLKKITDDVLEISKVSSGNVKMECENINISELLYQALGEYEDKMAQRQLELISHIEENMMVYVDGQHTWRVIDNCLNNACKYAKAQTRVYVDALMQGKDCLITIKNVSEQQLNVSSETLMERFVRGDRSRNTEGSGLGLNIAKSLTELQHGRFDILIDGDLFKIQLVLPQQQIKDSAQ